MHHDLTNGNITRSLLWFAFPMMVGNLLQQFYNVVDTLIVGQFLGKDALAAVGSSYSLMTFLTSILLGLCMGSGVAFSIYYGKKDSVRLKNSIFLAFCMIGGIALLITGIVFFGMDMILHLLDVYKRQEVYSNTGGQSSKATKTGATAQFAAGGKETKKKDLAGIAMSYGYVYVAQIAMGADFNQTVKAIAEAEAYPGPSLIIAYAPCINHGIKKGMSKAQTEEQLAVECGYWNNFRFNPAAEGAKFTLDSKEPKQEDYQAFLDGEVRYNALKRANPEKAEKLFAQNEKEAMERYAYLKKLVTLYGEE